MYNSRKRKRGDLIEPEDSSEDLSIFEQMPMEILFAVLDYLPQKQAFRLVCKKFYNATWKYEAPHFWLILDHKLFRPQNDDKLQALMATTLATTKEIHNIKVEIKGLKNVSKIREVLKKFGEKVVKINFEIVNYHKDSVPLAVIRKLFAFVSNASDVRFRLCFENMEKATQGLLTFPKNCLEEAFIASENLKLIDKQTRIKKLTLKLTTNTKVCLESLQVEDLTLHLINWKDSLEVTRILNGLTGSLKRLNLKNVSTEILSDKLLQTVVKNSPNLEALALPFDVKTAKGLRNIEKLKKLRELSLRSHSRSHFSEPSFKELAGLNNRRLTKLKIKADNLDAEIIEQISQSAPNLKEFDINYLDASTSRAIFENFRQVEKLLISSEGRAARIGDLIPQVVCHQNLKHLKIAVRFSSDSFEGLVKSCPNMERFAICVEYGGRDRDLNHNMVRQFRSVLRGWKQLTHLTWSNYLTQGDLNLILDYGLKLQFVEIHGLVLENEQEVRAMFNEKFGIIQVKRSLLMARDLKAFEEIKSIHACRSGVMNCYI